MLCDSMARGGVIESQFHRGLPGMPLVVLIHGMGIDARIWYAPDQVKILAGTLPLSSLLARRYRKMQTIYPALQEMGVSILSWSQSRPVGPIECAAEELRELLNRYDAHSRNGIILIGHSRGGLIARKHAEDHPDRILVLITIATPHHGTTLARWPAHVAPLASLAKMMSAISRGEFSRAVVRITQFLGSEGLRELLPDAGLIRSLKTEKPGSIRCVSFGGTSPDLVRIAGLSLLEAFSKVLPDTIVPDEIKPGLGDGLVAASSAVLPYADLHHVFPLNHAAMLFDGRVRHSIIKNVSGAIAAG